MTADVENVKRQMVFIQTVEVEDITADVLTRNESPGKVEIFGVGANRRNKAFLNLRRRFEILFNLLLFFSKQPVGIQKRFCQFVNLELGFHPCKDFAFIEWLGNIVHCA